MDTFYFQTMNFLCLMLSVSKIYLKTNFKMREILRLLFMFPRL